MTSDQHHNVLPALTDSLVPLANLHPHPQNARRRDDRAQTEIRQSLTTNGQYRRIVTRRLPDGTLQILAGHGTTDAARDLGWTHIAAEVHDDVDDQAAARIVAVDNRTSDLSADDPAALAELLQLIDDLEGSGWTDEEAAAIEASLHAGEPAQLTDPDVVPPPPATPQSRLGDVWQLGPHRLGVGSGTDHEFVARVLDGAQADMYLTDPPYNVDYTGKTAEALKIGGDAQDDETFRALLDGLFGTALEHTRPGGPAYVFHADSKGLAFRSSFLEAGWELKQVLVWVKDRFVLGRQDYHWQHEPILYGWAPGAAHTWAAGRDLTTLIDDETDLESMSKPQLLAMLRGIRRDATAIRHNRPSSSIEHPTMKPVTLYADLIEHSSHPGALLLDTCAGSGTLAIAAHQLGRRSAMTELDPHYADVILRRYAEHTGQVPTHATSGIPFTLPAPE